MNQKPEPSQNTGTPSLWRRFAQLACLALALGVGGMIPSARATLLVEELFDYSDGGVSGNQLNGTNLVSLNGQTTSLATTQNPTGLTGGWTAAITAGNVLNGGVYTTKESLI